MNLVVLVVDLALDGSVLYLHATKPLEDLVGVEGLAALSDFVEHLVPPLDVVAEQFVDMRGLDIPERLVGAPGLVVLVGFVEDLLELRVTSLDAELVVHLVQEVHIRAGVVTHSVLVVSHLLKATDNLDLLVQLLVPEGASLGKARLHDDCKVLDFNVKDHLLLDEPSTLGLEVDELFNPCLQQLLESLHQDLLNALVQSNYPEAEIAQVIKVKVFDNLLDARKSTLEVVLVELAVGHLREEGVDVLSLLGDVVDCFFESNDLGQELPVCVVLDVVVLLPVYVVEAVHQHVLSFVFLRVNEHGKLVCDLRVGHLEGAQRLLETHCDWVQFLELVRLELDLQWHLVVQLVPKERSLQIDLLLVKPEEVWV